MINETIEKLIDKNKHYMREGAENSKAQAQEAMLKSLEEMLQKLIEEAKHP